MQNYSKILEKRFEINQDGALFDDQVFYSNQEIKLLKGAPAGVIKMVHTAKFVFSGELQQQAPASVPVPPADINRNLKQAVMYAGRLIEKGARGRDAIMQASNHYDVTMSAIGSALGGHKKGVPS